jgi:hypothetical protein
MRDALIEKIRGVAVKLRDLALKKHDTCANDYELHELLRKECEELLKQAVTPDEMAELASFRVTHCVVKALEVEGELRSMLEALTRPTKDEPEN